MSFAFPYTVRTHSDDHGYLQPFEVGRPELMQITVQNSNCAIIPGRVSALGECKIMRTKALIQSFHNEWAESVKFKRKN